MNDVCRARPIRPSNSKCRVLGEDLPVRPEPDAGAGLGLRRPGRPCGSARTSAVNDAVGPSPSKTPGTPRRKLMPCWDGVRSTSTSSRADSALTTDAPTPCRPPVATYDDAAELAARVQLGEDHLDAGQPGLGLLVDRDAAAVVVHLGRAVGVERDLDQVAGAGQRLVHAVVDDLPQAVHETAGVGGPDVHARALADRLQPLEDEEVCCVVGVVGDRAAPGSVGLVGRACRDLEPTRDTPSAGAGTLPGWTAIRLYRGDITNRTRFRYRFRGIPNRIEHGTVTLNNNRFVDHAIGLPEEWKLTSRERWT